MTIHGPLFIESFQTRLLPSRINRSSPNWKLCAQSFKGAYIRFRIHSTATFRVRSFSSAHRLEWLLRLPDALSRRLSPDRASHESHTRARLAAQRLVARRLERVHPADAQYFRLLPQPSRRSREIPLDADDDDGVIEVGTVIRH